MKNSEVEAILKFYKDIDLDIRATSRWLEYFNLPYDTRGAVNYDGMPHGSNTTDKVALLAAVLAENDNMKNVRRLENRIRELKKLRTEILKEMSTLSPLHKAIIDSFYIRGQKWEQISEQINYSVRQCKNIRCVALEVLGGKLARNRSLSQSKIIAEIFE